MKNQLKKILSSLGLNKEQLVALAKKKCKKILINFSLLVIGTITGFGVSETNLIPLKKKDLVSISTNPVIQTTYPVSRTACNLLYNGSTRTAYWVYECVSKEDLEKKCNRKNVQFKEDPDIPEIVRSTLEDYKKSGFDRGHLAPSADRTYDCGVLQEVFYLSNMSPQLHSFNSGHWEKLERYVRALTNQYDKVHVFSIPLYLPRQEGDKKYVHYQVIGENNVAVPTHFAKVIFAGDKIFAFMLPHEDIDSNIPLEEFSVTLRDIEKASGFVFLPKKRKEGQINILKKKILEKSKILRKDHKIPAVSMEK
ncbi:MAG: DNA/RNA non-specific endonuclease [Chlamydiales bacterium]